MDRLLDVLMMFLYTYSVVCIFRKFAESKAPRLGIEIVFVLFITIIDSILNVTIAKTAELGIYYLLIELYLYFTYGREKLKFFISFILTFCIFQISDICAGVVFQSLMMSGHSSMHLYLQIIMPQVFVIVIACILSKLASKVYNANFNISEDKLLLVYTNVVLIVFMILVQYNNISKDTGQVMVVSLLLICFFLLISHFLFMILSKLYREKNEKKYIEMYNKIIEDSLENMKEFKHDYRNTLMSIGGFIESGNMDELKSYFNNNILKAQNAHNQNILGLANIKNKAVKGLLYGKISELIALNIDVNINIESEIDSFVIKDIDICKIIGILIDNAIEASLNAEKKVVYLGILNTDEDIYVILANTYGEQPILANIFNKGYSTKGINRGLGLSIIRDLNEKKYNNMDIKTALKDDMFNIEIIIKK